MADVWLEETSEARGFQMLLWATIIIGGLILLIGGGTFVYNFLNNLIFEPIKGGKITAAGMIMLGAFLLVLFNKFRRRNYKDEVIAEQLRRSRRMF